MRKVKDLVGATFRALGVSGLVASLGLAASGCVPMVAAGAGAYAGTKMAQKDNSSANNDNKLEWIEAYNARVCYEENEKSVCVCGGGLYRHNVGGYLLLKSYEDLNYSIEDNLAMLKAMKKNGDPAANDLEKYIQKIIALREKGRYDGCDKCLLIPGESIVFSFSAYKNLRISTW